MSSFEQKTLKLYDALVGNALHSTLWGRSFSICRVVMWQRWLFPARAVTLARLSSARRNQNLSTAIMRSCPAGRMHPYFRWWSWRNSTFFFLRWVFGIFFAFFNLPLQEKTPPGWKKHELCGTESWLPVLPEWLSAASKKVSRETSRQRACPKTICERQGSRVGCKKKSVAQRLDWMNCGAAHSGCRIRWQSPDPTF